MGGCGAETAEISSGFCDAADIYFYLTSGFDDCVLEPLLIGRRTSDIDRQDIRKWLLSYAERKRDVPFDSRNPAGILSLLVMGLH